MQKIKYDKVRQLDKIVFLALGIFRAYSGSFGYSDGDSELDQ